MEARSAEALRRSIRQPSVGFRENMLEALEGAGVLTLCNALNGVDTITRIPGIGKRTKSIVEAWAGIVARELGMTLNELKVEAEKMERDTTGENRPLVRVSTVPSDLKDKPLEYELPEIAASKGQITDLRNTLRKNGLSTDSDGRPALSAVEAILRSPSLKHIRLHPRGTNWKLAKACLETTLRQHGYELVWGGVLADEAKAETPKSAVQTPADVLGFATESATLPKPQAQRITGRNRSRGVMGDIERHLREVGSPQTLDEMSDFIRQSVVARLQESKDVFVETVGRWGLKDWSRPHDARRGTDEATSPQLTDSVAIKLRERYALMREGIITEADFESYKKRMLEV